MTKKTQPITLTIAVILFIGFAVWFFNAGHHLSSTLGLIIAFFLVIMILILLGLGGPSIINDNKEWLRENKVAFFIYSMIIIGAILFYLNYRRGHLNDLAFWDNVLVEAHGMFFDVILFGVILTLYEKFIGKAVENKKLQEEIDDFMGWEEKEAMFRIVGNIKRLLRNNASKIDVSSCYLEGAKLMNLNLDAVKMVGTNLENADLTQTKLTNAKLIGTNFKNAMLAMTDFEGSEISALEFDGAFLGGTNFANLDLSSCSFKDAKFNMATILENAIVDDIEWFEKVIRESESFRYMMKKYMLDDEVIKDKNGYLRYKIIRRSNR